MKPQFVFQQSMIWEAGDPVDPEGEMRVVRSRDERRARKKLGDAGTGRVWVLLARVSGTDVGGSDG